MPWLAGMAAGQDKEPPLDFRKLVESLASPNRPIRCDNVHETISIPPNYDWKAQERIEKKRKFLFNHCDEALPQLIEGCTDAHYSLTWRWVEEGYCYNSCVGETCLEIIAHHLEVFRRCISFDGPSQWHKYSFVPRLHSALGKDVTDQDKKGIRDWWQTRKGKSLRELQLEAFDWAIEKRKIERDEEKAERLSSDGLARDDRDADILGEIKRLRRLRELLNRSEKPLPPDKMHPSLLSPEGRTTVPWLEEKAKEDR